MPNDRRHHEAWEANLRAIERHYLEASWLTGHLVDYPELYGLYRSGLQATNYLLNEATDDDEFFEGLRQQSEVCRVNLLRYLAQRSTA